MGKRKRLCIVDVSTDMLVEDNHLDETLGHQVSETQCEEPDSQRESQNLDPQSPERSNNERASKHDQVIGQGTLKKVRGPTRKVETWNMLKTRKIEVIFNKDAKPVGDEGNELVQYLGTLVRMSEHVGIDYSDWRKVPMHKKEDMYTLVKEKFIIRPVETSAIKKWIFFSMGKKWRTWKCTLKARAYDPSLTPDEIVAQHHDIDKRVNKNQFKDLVARWFTPEYQRTCDVRRVSRSKMEEPHVTGTKSFARLAHEEALKNDGVSLSRGDMYVKTRTRNDGSIVDEKAAGVVASLQALKEAASDSTTGQSTIVDYSNDDYSKVKGPEKRGYIRLVGRMPAAKESGSSSSTNPQTIQQLQDELACQKNIVNVMLNLFQEHIPNANLSGVLSNLNIQIPDISSSLPSNSHSVYQRSPVRRNHSNGN